MTMRPEPHPRPARLAALLLCLALPARAGVLVVGPAAGPGIDFTQIQPAVDAAAEGDTILVREGTYLWFQVLAKSVTVVADGDQVFVRPPAGQISSSAMIVIRDLAAGQEVLVRGLRTSLGARIQDCLGAVWLDELECSGDSPTTCSQFPIHGAEVLRSSRVTFTRCLLVAEQANPNHIWGFAGASGVKALDSSVQLFDCTIVGATGPNASPIGPAVAGSAGLSIATSTVTAVGCTIVGGGGGLNAPICTAVHEPGGAGVAFGPGGTLRSAETTAAGGARSLEPMCPGQTGPQGPALSGIGTIVALPGFARHLRASGPVRGGGTLTFELAGQPAEVPLLLLSTIHEPLALLNGSLLLGLPPAEVFVLPALPEDGQATLAFPVPDVGPAQESLHLYAQAAFLAPGPAVWLAAGTTVVLLDASL